MNLYMTLIIATLGVGLVIGTVPAQDEIDYIEMIEDLQVMCRIIDETMDETFENDYVKGGFFRRGGCQHLYLKDYGAMFLLDVRFPVAKKKMKIVKTEKKTDLWEKHEREVRHQSHPEKAAWVVDKNESYRKEKVDKLKKQLAYLVGEYGSRIGQLAFDDTISFVVFGYPDYTVDFEKDILDFEWHVVERAVGDEISHPRETAEELRRKNQALREAIQELEKIKRELDGTTEEESRDDEKKVINRRNKTIVIEEKKDEEIEDSQSKKGKRLRIPVPPTPPTRPGLPHRFRGKPATTLILTFKQSQLEGKTGADWEALLTAAEVVEY